MVIGYSDFGRALKIKYPQFQYDVTSVPQISDSPVQQPVNLIKFDVETVTQTADNPAAAFAFLKTYTDVDTITGIAHEQKVSGPYLSQLNQAQDDFPNKQILTGQSVFKKSRIQFDQAFRQMITDVSQNGLAADQALDNGAQTINLLLAKDDE